MNKINTFILLFTICLIEKTCFAQDNTLEDSEKYWQMRAKEAKRRLMQAYHPEPFNVTNHFNLHTRKMWETNNTRRSLIKKYKGPCQFRNPIDECWRCRPDWEQNRQQLAKCAIGFGSGTTGGLGGRIYVVTDSSDRDMVNPKPGTLRHAVIQEEPLWIIFAADMSIRLNQELIMTSNKTIDGRGVHVVITHGAGITIQYVENVIIHGIKIREIVVGSGGIIRDSVNHFGFRTQSDGDAISIFGSHHVWIDHVSMSKTYDGLIDIIKGSTAITISNCHMTQQDKVFLFGASRLHLEDRNMQITVAYTHFGKGLTERMPRVRYGFFHVVNNDYTHWEMYAIGGSENPTIVSQGNRFIAPNLLGKEEVTHREHPNSAWDSGTWISEHDLLLNGATFMATPNAITPHRAGMIPPMPGSAVGSLTLFAGPLKCIPNRAC